MSPDNLFFDETREQSIIKANIVSSYFWAWAKVIIPAAKKRGGNRVAYIDLFAGPGRYKDGTKSTPLLVLERAIRDPEMREVLVTMFNDKDENNSRSLEQAISELPYIEQLKLGRPKRLSAIDRFLDSQCQSHFSDVRWRPIFKEKRFIQGCHLRATLIFTTL
jgi:three-Cys-motif partner protein